MARQVVWKYVKTSLDQETYQMPANAEFLGTKVRFGVVNMWFLVNPDRPKIPRKFRLVATGEFLPAELRFKYCATVISPDESEVLHLFEVLNG